MSSDTFLNPFDPNRAPTRFKLLNHLLKHRDGADVYEIQEVLYGHIRHLDKREAMQCLSPMVSKTNKALLEAGHLASIVKGTREYSYMISI